ncbi:hypothetical protein NFI96_017955 [Prochilodus magdalenae]|nr:hypothetical protein NFI96_017955 [Prochilodus magdalenae]
MDYWNHVLRSDETKINLFGSDGVKHVWRQPGKEYKDKCVLPTVKHFGGSVMVWDCMSGAGCGELQFIEGTMNASMYCDHVKEHKVSNIHQLREVVKKEWKRIPVATFEALVNSMPKRVEADLESNGGLTKHYTLGTI